MDNVRVEDLLVNNPNMSASAFLNLLKSKGFEIIRRTENKERKVEDEAAWDRAKKIAKKEYSEKHPNFWAIVMSIYKKIIGKNEQAEDTTVKTELLRETNNFVIREAAKSGDPVGATKFEVILIEEGLGQFGTAYYYNKDLLKKSFYLFEGKKIYADHPTTIEEQTRPERSVRDILGFFENCEYVEENGRGKIKAVLNILPDEHYRWARALLRESLELQKKNPDKSLVGLSIAANGNATKTSIDTIIGQTENNEEIKNKLLVAKQKGIEFVNYVTDFVEVISCDLVTEAGAGGKVISIKESKKGEKEMVDEQEKHADEQQDIEIIKKMIKDYLQSDDKELNNEAMKIYQALSEKNNIDKAVSIPAACEAAKIKLKEKEKNEKQEESKDTNQEKDKEIKESLAQAKIKELEDKIRFYELEKEINDKIKFIVDEEIRKEIKEAALFLNDKEKSLKIIETFSNVLQKKYNKEKEKFSFSFSKKNDEENLNMETKTFSKEIFIE